MKRILLSLIALVLGVTAMGQQKIQLRSADRAECVSSNFTQLRASFSFSDIEATDVETTRGQFSWLTMANTVIGGNEGDPQIPVVNELIAIPFGANPVIRVTSYSSTDYRLNELGVHTLVPRQPSLRKDQRPEEVPFIYNASAYQTRGLRSEPRAFVSIEGTMRGIQIGKMTIEPVSYDPVNNTLRVFNDIEVEVIFDDADAVATEDMLVKTYSPYFDVIYDQLFNGRMVRDIYSQHPDLYTTPVKMIVITTATYANNATFQNWVNWKKQKGIYTTVYTTATTGTSSSNIKTFIRNQYNTNAPTFVVIVGDTGDVTYSLSSNTTSKVTDLYYSSTTDNDLYPEMFLSRMPVSSTTELTNLLNKILTYEQYTMANPSYLGNTLLIAGWDSSWTPKVGKPTIQYANTYYFNSSNNINPYVFLTTGSGQTTCYNYINDVGFANYTAHGGETGWSDPGFSVSNVNSMTNNDKYLWAMGNCCLAANWGYNGTCFAEALLRAANKGAFGYIGSCPETYWWEDYYFGVGATTIYNQMPTMAQTQTGVYDAMFDDTGFNTLNSVPFLGNIAVAYAHAGSYTSSVTDKYYWEAYHTLGDGSVMPYHTVPSANNVSHASTIGIGANTFTVSADAGSYVSITRNNEILGVAQVGSTGTVEVPITPVTNSGDVLVVVTRHQRQPYMQTIQAISMDGPYISVDGYAPETAHVGDNTNLSITFKNVGAEATSGTTTVTLAAVDSNATIVTPTMTFGALAADATTTVNGFCFRINSGVADGTIVPLHYTAVNGSNTWEGIINITAGEAVLEYQHMNWDGSFTPGQTMTVTAKFKNTGHYQATNAMATMSSTSNYITINNSPITVGTVAVDQEVSCQFNVTIAPNCPENAQIPVTFTMTADGGASAQGTGTLKNACNVIFNLSDSYGDGWNGNILTVSFDDGTPSQELTISSSTSSSESYVLEIGNGVHVTLTWTTGSYAYECSFTVSYEGDLIIYQSSGTPSAGVIYEFDCNCAAATAIYNVNVASSNTNHGTVSGGGEFNYGQSCTVSATPAEGYMFTYWTVDGEMVSSEAEYTFVVTGNIDLVAHFSEGQLIGDGGTTTNSFLPSYNWYKYTLSQQIYTAAELGEAGTIYSIAFFNGGAEKTRTYDFYLKATTKNSFSNNTDWVAVSASDKVFTGSVTMAANEWTIINFDTPFEYDGTSNLVLVTDDNSGAYTNAPHMACRVFDASNQSIYIYSDNTNYDPFAPSSYSGTVLSLKNQLILIKEVPSVEIFNITVSANPADAGTVSGGGEYGYDESCTVTATPAEGYYFMNWTVEGETVSSDAEYTFNVTEDMDLVANFNLNSYQVTATSNPAEGGTVAFIGNSNISELTYDFEDGTTQGWTTLQGTNGDSPANWMHCADYSMDDYSTGFGHNASDGFMFSESFTQDGTSVHPDNYLVSPQIQLGGSISFWATNMDYEYGAEHFAVAVSMNGNTDANDFTTIQEWTLPVGRTGGTRTAADGIWYEYTADLSAFSGLGYVAIHHFDCYDQWMLCVDDITIVMGQPTTNSSTFNHGESCTVTATANEGYYFSNWTVDGETVSSEAEYTFIVTEDIDLVANFSLNSYQVMATSNPAEGGTVAFIGNSNISELIYDFEDGTTQGWTILQGTNGDSPYNWMYCADYSMDDYSTGFGHNASDGFMFSESFTQDGTSVHPDNYLVSPQIQLGGSISFWATNMDYEYGAEHFAVAVSTNGNTDANDFTTVQEWTLPVGRTGGTRTAADGIWYEYVADLSAFSGLGYVAIHHFDCYDQWMLCVDDITIVEGYPTTVSGNFNYGETCTVTATANEGYIFVNWTENGETVSTDADYSFEVTADRALVANFEPSLDEQTIALAAGWNWCSLNVEITLDDLKTALVEALPSSSISIKSRTQNTTYNPNTHRWSGSVVWDLSMMYRISVTTECEITLEGQPINPAEHPVTISNGVNWIAFPLSESISLTNAFAGFAVNGDQIKSRLLNAQYRNNRWNGQFNTLVPGQGYIYISNTAGDRIFTFPVNAK